MKSKIVLLIIVLVIIVLSWIYVMNEGVISYKLSTTNIEFIQDEINMGQILQENPKTTVFYFTNTGENPLVIQMVKTSCGCTEPEWPKKPIKPGGSGEIKVTYDAKYPGRFVKSITVFCNSEIGAEKLLVKGEVKFNANI